MTSDEYRVEVSFPLCCIPTDGASIAEILYCTYNRGGDHRTAGLNFAGDPCPIWAELPANVRAKWVAVAMAVTACKGVG